jgi:1-pyrroline-5-carboxylate dehydrogenase
MRGECIDAPAVIGGKRFFEGPTYEVREPHAHARIRARCPMGGAELAERGMTAALGAAHEWANMPFEARARIFSKAADLLAGPYRAVINAATMLGQSKTAYQAEIDAACELADFLRFNVHYASTLLAQPSSPPGVLNAVESRPLEGFVLAVTPFNFTAIAGNLPTAPALLGNVIVWKPAESQSLAAHHTMRLFEEAGMPPGVINLIYGDGAQIAGACLKSPHLAGVHFTGSTQVFRSILSTVGENISRYRSFPRVVGETGGKDFVVAHPSADLDALAIALVRGAFEYQGQKCSAASRAYVPKSLWPRLKEQLVAHIKSLRMGDPTDFRMFMGAVIHERSYDRLHGWLTRLGADNAVETIVADGWSKAEGYFAGPTLVRVDDPKHDVMQEELFGPLLSVFVYDDAKWLETLQLVDQTSPFALTGAVFAQDRAALLQASSALRQSAGNFYVNDKPTGAVVGQQPFGGARSSGTNDKAGSALNLLRWCSPRVIKETYVPPKVLGYPSMSEA